MFLLFTISGISLLRVVKGNFVVSTGKMGDFKSDENSFSCPFIDTFIGMINMLSLFLSQAIKLSRNNLFTNVSQIYGCFFPRDLVTSHFINLYLTMVFQYLEPTLQH